MTPFLFDARNHVSGTAEVSSQIWCAGRIYQVIASDDRLRPSYGAFVMSVFSYFKDMIGAKLKNGPRYPDHAH